MKQKQLQIERCCRKMRFFDFAYSGRVVSFLIQKPIQRTSWWSLTPYDESIFWNLFLRPTRSNDRGYYRLSPLTPATEDFRLDRKYNERFPRLAQPTYQFPFYKQAFTAPHLRFPPTRSFQFTYARVFASAFRKHFRHADSQRFKNTTPMYATSRLPV